ncbi:hypothetical protein Tco_0935838 [Tanacetum coccineum]
MNLDNLLNPILAGYYIRVWTTTDNSIVIRAVEQCGCRLIDGVVLVVLIRRWIILPKSILPEIEEVEFDPEGDILFLESLLYDNSYPRPPEALQANSNAIESLPPSHIPVADNDSLMEEIDLFLADDGSIPPGIESDDVDSVDDDTSIFLPEFESFYVDYPFGNSNH